MRGKIAEAALWCPAYDGPCGYACVVRSECESNPEGVRAMMAVLDPGTVEALARRAYEILGP